MAKQARGGSAGRGGGRTGGTGGAGSGGGAARPRREPSPPEALRHLARSLDEHGLAPGYVLRGDEPWFHDRAIELVRLRAEREGMELCLHAADGGADFSLARVVDDLSGSGLFASRRLVVVRGPEDLLKKVDDRPSPLARAIQGFLDAAGGCVVLSGASLRADLATVKALLAAGGQLLTLRKLWDGPPPWNPDPRQAELVQWLVQRAAEKGVRLAPAQAVYVCAATGNDLAALDDNLERLRSAPADRRGDLGELVAWDATTAPWTVAEHLAAGELPRALGGIETLFRGGFQDKSGKRLLDSVALTAMLTGSLLRGVRQSLALAAELDAGAPDADAAAAVGLRGRPETVRETLARARSIPADAWRERLEDVLDLERRAKSGGEVDAADFARLSLRWARRAEAAR